MSQLGGGRLGGIALSAGGMVTQNWQQMPQGAIEKLFLTVAFSFKSSAAAFATVVSTAGSAAAEAIDDMDLVLNALFTQIGIYFDPQTFIGSMTPAQWRTCFGLFNKRDFAGNWTNGLSCPISSGSVTALKVVIPIPVSLSSYFLDGEITRQGSQRLKTGQIDYTAGASLTPNVVLANGTAAISAVSVSITAETGNGDPGDVGMTYQIKRQQGLPTIYDLGAELRLAILDQDPSSTNAASAYRVGDTELFAPSDFQAKFQMERIPDGGFDITARCTPLVWVEPNRRFSDFVAYMGRSNRYDVVSGKSTVNLYDIRGLGAPASQVERVATQVGAGGPVSIAHPSPLSLPAGSKVPAALAGMLGMRILPGTVSNPGGMQAATPADAATHAVKKDAATRRAFALLGGFARR